MPNSPKTKGIHARTDPSQSGVKPHGHQPGGERGPYEEEPGIYVDPVSGEALFASSDMYETGKRWLNFSKPLEPVNIREVQSTSQGLIRTEVRSLRGDNHLGHIFLDGPPDRGGLRYCIHAALVRFVPRQQMAAQGYGAYLEHLEGGL